MFLGLSEFTDALQKGEERRENVRRENAKLYNEFVQMNPGASTQERLDFANKLIKDTGVGSAGLPTKAQMERNYKKFQDEEAKKRKEEERLEAERAFEKKRLGLTVSKEIAGFLAPNWGTSGFDDDVKKQVLEFGIDEALIPSIKKQAQDTAWLTWKTDNADAIDAYRNNPNAANWEALKTQAGELWADRVGSTYQNVRTSWLENNKIKFANELHKLAQGAKDITTYNLELELLKEKYDPEVYKDVSFGSSLEQVYDRRMDDYAVAVDNLARTATSVDDFNTGLALLQDQFRSVVIGDSERATKSASEFVLEQRAKEAKLALEQARNISDPAEYEAVKQAIIAEYNADAVPNFDAMDKVVKDNQIRAQEKENTGLVNEAIRFAYQAKDRNEYETLKNTLTATLGGTPDFKAADDIFTAEELKREQNKAEDDLRAANQAVNSAEAGIKEAVKGNETADDVIADIEANLSAAQGRTVTLNDDQRNTIKKQFGDMETQIAAIITNSLESMGGEAGDIGVINQAKADFVAAFKNNLETQDIKFTDAHKTKAEAHFDAALTRVRAQTNIEEEKTLKNAKQGMGDVGIGGRGANYSQKDLLEYTSSLMNNPDVIGDSDPEEVGAMIASRTNQYIKEISEQLNIPMGDAEAEAIVNQIVQDAVSQAGVTGSGYLQGGNITREQVQKAFITVYSESPFSSDPSYQGLEANAIDQAMAKMKLGNLEDIFKLSPEQQQEFRLAFEAAREDQRNAAFDIQRGDTVQDDIAPSKTVVSNSQTLVTEATDFNYSAITNMQPLDYFDQIQAEDQGLIDKMEEFDVLDNKLSVAKSAIQGEINRLTILDNSPVYNEVFAEDKAKIQEQLTMLNNQAKLIDDQIQLMDDAFVKTQDMMALGEIERKRIDEENARLLAEETARRKAEEQQRIKTELRNNSFNTGTAGDRLNKILDFITPDERVSTDNRRRRGGNN